MMSTSTSSSTNVQDEILLIERVFLKFASADNDEALQAAISKYLAPCLLKLGSQQDGVRKKVMELLVHINKRIKNNPKILLPLQALLIQYQDPAATSFVTNFTIIYIKMGFPRVSVEEQAALIPAILSSLEGKPTVHQDSLLLMIIPSLSEINPPEKEKENFLGLAEKPHTTRLFLSFLKDYLLLPYGSHPSLRSIHDEEMRVPPCMSEYSWKRASGESPVKAEVLEKNKCNICKFLGTGLIDPMETAILAILAMADTRHSVSSKADDVMRKISGFVDRNDPVFVSKLYSLFLGSNVMPPQNKKAVQPDKIVTPANSRLRLKLMPYLLNSREAAALLTSSIQVIFDLLFGTGGSTNAKLKAQAITFVHHVIQFCPEHRLSGIGPVLLAALIKLVTSQEEKINNPKLRADCYVAIGKLGAALPRLINMDITVIQTFFEAMSSEDKETQMSVRESLSLMAGSFKKMDHSNLKFLDSLLATYVENDEHQVRQVAVQYAGEVFEPDHASTRYTLLLGSGDPKEEVASAAKKHLYGILNATNRAVTGKVLPNFELILSMILEKANVRIKTQKRVVIGGNTLAFTPEVYVEMLNYLRICLLNSVDCGQIPQREWLNDPLMYAPLVTRYLNNMFSKKSNLVIKFIEFAEKMVTSANGLPQSQCLVQLIGCTSERTYQLFEKKISWMKDRLNTTRSDVREVNAQLFGIILSKLEIPAVESAVNELTRSFKEKTLEYQHGIILALGYGFGNKILSLRNNDQRSFNDWSVYRSAVQKYIVNHLDNNVHVIMTGGACHALAELGRCGPLPLDKSEKLKVTECLLNLVKNPKISMKVREKAALASGQICIGDVEYPHRELIIDGLVNTAREVKDIELHLTVGEALVYASLGPLSPMGRDLWKVSEEDFIPLTSVRDERHLLNLVNDLVTKHTQSTHPNTKQASCLWLLALVKNAVNTDAVKLNLLKIQSSFMSLLGESNELVQDAASKGLGLVYESSSDEQKKEMVGILVETLLDTSSSIKKVSSETQVFKEGELGKDPSGGNISTYKELCSLATDLNQPDLVYKFMHLANYNATWETRKGAAFGFSTIAVQAGKQLEPHLNKIIPKLYRYQFDPTPNIQRSMTSIWNSLVPESNKTVDKYLNEIVEELHRNLTSNQWRVRESCCGALQDLLRGRTLDNALEHLASIWEDLFRVMDDIKESVRLSAGKAALALSRSCIRMTELGPSSGNQVVKAILPTLLEKGLLSTVAEVKSIALNTVMKMTKSAGSLLKPHLSLLIPALLESCSELESKDANYLSTRLANDASVQEKLDAARIAAAKSSPMMECINYVLQYVDCDVLQGLVPHLVDLIKNSVGLNTKGVVAHFVTSLTHHCHLDIQSYTGKLLSAFVSGLSDRNRTIRKIYAGAIGHLMKSAKPSSIEKLIAKLRGWYMSDTSRLSVAYTFKAISQYNPDVMKNYAAYFMPIAFLAMHEKPEKSEDGNDEESSNEIVHIWEDVWNDGTPGTEGGIRLYLDEIIAILAESMSSQQWKVKAQAARGLGTVASKMGKDGLSGEKRKDLLILLMNGLTGRTWNGKESLLQSISSVCSAGRPAFNDSDLSEEKLITAVFKECKKDNNVEYKICAIQSGGKILESLKVDYFERFYEIVYPIIKVEEDESKNTKEEEDDEETRKTKLDLQDAAFEAIGRAWPLRDAVETQKRHLEELLKVMSIHIEATTKKVQTCIVKAIGEIFEKWAVEEFEAQRRSAIFVSVAEILAVTLSVPKSLALRTESMNSLFIAIKLLERYPNCSVNEFRETLSKSVDDVIKDLASDPSIKARGRELKKSLLAIPSD